MTRWKPIATAPLDRKILLRVPDGASLRDAEGSRHKRTYMQIGEYSNGAEWRVIDDQTGGPTTVDPTHWYDIPSEDEGFQ